MAFDFDLDEELLLEQELFQQQEADSFNDDIDAGIRNDELINRNTEESGQGISTNGGTDFKEIEGAKN